MSRDSYSPWSAAGVSASGSSESLCCRRLFHGGFSLAVFPQVFDEVVTETEGFCLSHVFAVAAPAKTPLHISHNISIKHEGLRGEHRHIYGEDILKTWKHAAQRRGNTWAKGVHLYWPCGSGWRVQRSFECYGRNIARPAFL